MVQEPTHAPSSYASAAGEGRGRSARTTVSLLQDPAAPFGGFRPRWHYTTQAKKQRIVTDRTTVTDRTATQANQQQIASSVGGSKDAAAVTPTRSMHGRRPVPGLPPPAPNFFRGDGVHISEAGKEQLRQFIAQYLKKEDENGMPITAQRIAAHFGISPRTVYTEIEQLPDSAPPATSQADHGLSSDLNTQSRSPRPHSMVQEPTHAPSSYASAAGEGQGRSTRTALSARQDPPRLPAPVENFFEPISTGGVRVSDAGEDQIVAALKSGASERSVGAHFHVNRNTLSYIVKNRMRRPVLNSQATGRPRRWSAAEELRVEESVAPAASTVEVAGPDDVHPDPLAASWQQAPTAASAGGTEVSSQQDDEGHFAAVCVAPEQQTLTAPSGSCGSIEIEFANGARLWITGVVDEATLTAVVAVLADGRPR
jgi:hypothetical protein